jgi:transposase-like protein
VGGDHGGIQAAGDDRGDSAQLDPPHQIDGGDRDGVSSAAAEIRALERRDAELEQTNVILKAATTFFARESDPRNHR